jgi:hypothetical protein
VTHLTDRQWRQLTGENAPRKYNNAVIETTDGRFDSQREYQRWCELNVLQRAGEISGLHRQVSYDLRVNGVLICRYVADFVYANAGGVIVVEDVKGVRTGVYLLKKKLMKALYETEIQEIR